jgi:hypothetical protein
MKNDEDEDEDGFNMGNLEKKSNIDPGKLLLS